MRITVPQIRDMARRGERIAVLTAYDAPSARLLDAAGVHILLVGDSLGNVVLGYDNPLPVTMEDMIRHTAAVVRGSSKALVVADMPFLSFQISESEAIRNAGLLIKQTGCQAVKLEGGRHMAEVVRALVTFGMPVMGHIGLTPQAQNEMGGYHVQGRTAEQAKVLLEDALALETAGAFSIVLEYVAAPVARLISERLVVPTIGIGAGPDCDGQVLVLHDMLGLGGDTQMKHAKRYADVGQAIGAAAQAYVAEVRDGAFPDEAHSFSMRPGEEALLGEL